MPIQLGTFNFHFGTEDGTPSAYNKADFRDALIRSLRTALQEAEMEHLSARDLDNGTVRLMAGTLTAYAHNCTVLQPVRVDGECEACGMDWEDDMDYCTGCESD